MSTLTPSPMRTITLPSAALSPTAMLAWPPKDPGTSDDYSLDISAYLTESGGATITSFTATADNGNTSTLTVQPQPVSGSVMTVILGGGGDASWHSVQFVASLSNGNTYSVTCWILVQCLSANTAMVPSVIRGARGVGIADAQVLPNGHLQLQLTNGQTIDAGSVAGPAWTAGVTQAESVDAVSVVQNSQAALATPVAVVAAGLTAGPNVSLDSGVISATTDPSVATQLAGLTASSATQAQGLAAETGLRIDGDASLQAQLNAEIEARLAWQSGNSGGGQAGSPTTALSPALNFVDSRNSAYLAAVL